MALIEEYALACSCGAFDPRTWAFPPSDPTCKSCGGQARVEFRGLTRFTANVPYTARKRFCPHFNSSLGMEIESPEHFEAMKQKFGAVDADLHAGSRCDGGVPASVPRDIERQSAHAHAVIEANAADPLVQAEAAADEALFAQDPITVDEGLLPV